MNTKHFDYITAIAQTGSLSQASKLLGVTQPVLSRYVANLEAQLGVRLFIKANRQLHITDAGNIYLNGVRRMKELQTQMTRSLDILQGIEELNLSIGMSPYRGGRELASFYPDLLGHFPNLNLKVAEGSSRQLLEQLYRKELSAIINLYDSTLMPRTKAATMIKAELLIAIPDYHPVASQPQEEVPPGTHAASQQHKEAPPTLTARQLNSLHDIPFVYLDSDTLLGQIADQACRRYEFTPQVLLRTANSIAVTSLLKSGSYAGFVLESTTQDLDHMRFFRFPHPVTLYSGMIFLEEHQPTAAETYLYYLIYEQARHATPGVLYQNELGKYLWKQAQKKPAEESHEH